MIDEILNFRGELGKKLQEEVVVVERHQVLLHRRACGMLLPDTLHLVMQHQAGKHQHSMLPGGTVGMKHQRQIEVLLLKLY